MTTSTGTTAVRRGRDVLERLVDRGQRKAQRAFGYAAAAMPDGPIASLCILADRTPLTVEHTYLFYTQGLFPMDFSGTLRWQSPDPRSVLLLSDLHVGSRLRTYLRRGLFDIRFDCDPDGVLQRCAQREQTWLTPRLLDMYRGFDAIGALHTVEAWRDSRLVGGAFGVSIGRVFTVESMFHEEDHASKIAFVHLARHLSALGFEALDCQEHKPNFERFGAIEMPREEFRRLLARGLAAPVRFTVPAASASDAQTAVHS